MPRTVFKSGPAKLTNRKPVKRAKPLKPGAYRTKVVGARVDPESPTRIIMDLSQPVKLGEERTLSYKAPTKKERELDAKYSEGYMAGQRNEALQWELRQKQYETQLKAAKGEQLAAVTELIKATTKNLSSCGYLISKLNGGSGW